MRKKNKELNIFSMSALDLFASALGAFILITLILLPYYNKTAPVPPTPAEPAQACPVPQPIPECPACPIPDPVPTPNCPPPPPPVIKVVDNLLLMTVEWTARADVDLHVYAPEGHYFYSSSNRTFPGAPGKFVTDNTTGGRNAIESWKSFSPTIGEYRICVRLYSSSTSPGSVAVRAQLDKPTGPITFRTISFGGVGQEQCFLRFRIKNDFEFERI